MLALDRIFSNLENSISFDTLVQNEIEREQNLNSLLRNLMLIGFVYPMYQVDPTLSRFFVILLRNEHISEEILHLLQFDSLENMTKVFINLLDEDLAKKILPDVVTMMAFYFWEKLSDDLAQFNGKSNSFDYKDQVSQLDELAMRYLSGEEVTGSVYDLDINHIDNDINETILKLLDKYLSNFGEAIPPNLEKRIKNLRSRINSVLLLINFYSAKVALDRVRYPSVELSGLEKLRQFTVNSFYERYSSMDFIVEDPGMDINSAMGLGIQSILTNSTFGSFILFLCNHNSHVKKYVESNQDLLIETITQASFMIRALNDAGVSLEYPSLFKRIVNSYREALKVEYLAPRDFFQFFKKFIDENPEHELSYYRDFCWRFINDSVKHNGEYNMVLCSEMTGSADQQWEQFFENLNALAEQYTRIKASFFENLKAIDKEQPVISNKIGDFVHFNYRLYSEYQRDYTTSLGDKIKSALDSNGQGYRSLFR